MPDRAAPTAGLPRPQAEAPASAPEADARLARTRARHALGTPANTSDQPRPGRPSPGPGHAPCPPPAVPVRYRASAPPERRAEQPVQPIDAPTRRSAARRPGQPRRLGSRRDGRPRRQAPDRAGRGFKPIMIVTPGGRPTPFLGEWPPRRRATNPPRPKVGGHIARMPVASSSAPPSLTGRAEPNPPLGGKPRQGDEARRIGSPCTLRVASGNGEAGRRREPGTSTRAERPLGAAPGPQVTRALQHQQRHRQPDRQVGEPFFGRDDLAHGQRGAHQ